MAGRQCPVHSIAEPISVNVTRTVHKEEGTFEATLQIWRDSARTQDLLCVIIPFQVSSGMPSIPSKHLDSFEPSHDSEPSVVADEKTGGLLLLQSG
ncbi:MAG: hypothetical protein Q8P67_13205 [archaeon]|nr:hypothetical protein [archaeon]